MARAQYRKKSPKYGSGRFRVSEGKTCCDYPTFPAFKSCLEGGEHRYEIKVNEFQPDITYCIVCKEEIVFEKATPDENIQEQED